MYINVEQDWPAYVLLGLVVFFFIYVIVKGNAQSNFRLRRNFSTAKNFMLYYFY